MPAHAVAAAELEMAVAVGAQFVALGGETRLVEALAHFGGASEALFRFCRALTCSICM